MKEEAVTIIGGADGPTSIFLAGKYPGKRPLKERARQAVYQCRYRLAEKRIRACPHTLKDVVSCAREKYRAVEIPKSARVYRECFQSAREGLLLLHRPELFGELAGSIQPRSFDRQSAQALLRQCRLRSKKAASIPERELPMDYHIYEIRTAGGKLQLEVDYRWELFGISYSGSKRAMRRLKKIARKLCIRYGVTKEDIRNKTKRYRSLAHALSGSA